MIRRRGAAPGLIPTTIVTRLTRPTWLTRLIRPASGTATPGRLLALALAAGCAAALSLAGCGGEDGGAAGTRVDQADPGRQGDQRGGDAESGAAASALVRQAALPRCPDSADLPAVDGGLPRQTLDCLGAGPRVTLSGLRGRPMVINAWASWCPPCGREMPLLVQARRAAGERVLFLGVDIQNSREQGLAWARDARMNFPSVHDPDGEVKTRLRLLGPPVTYLVRPDGRIAYTHTGPLDSLDELAGLINDHLGVRL